MIDANKVSSVLISRTDRLGDVILTLPLAGAARKIFPGARIYFLVKKYPAEIIRGYEGIDEVIALDDFEDLRGLADKIRALKPDLVINVKPDFRLSLLFFTMGIRYRIGTGYRWFSFLYNRKVYEHRKTALKHESDYNLNLLGNFFPGEDFGRQFHFHYTDEEKSSLDSKLSQYNANLSSRFVIVHPGSGNSAKDIGINQFVKLCEMILSGYPQYRIYFTGTGDECRITDEIAGKLSPSGNPAVVNLCGKLALRELLILIDHCSLFVSNSTGPVHIAGALSKDIIGFYPNSPAMSAKRWGPLGGNALIVNPKSGDDMGSISEDDIRAALEKKLKAD